MPLSEPDLFTYPRHPGHKAQGTSRVAADKMASRAPTLRDQVLSLLKDAALTADECASKLNVTVLACRPRLSELARMGLIIDTGKTRKNESGVSASVWRAA